MSKYKTLFSNTLIFTISNFSSKLLLFFMLPLYVRFLSTEEFGIIAIIMSTVGLMLPIFTLSISESALRFSMVSNENKQQVFSFGIKVIVCGFVLLLLFYPLMIRIDLISNYVWLIYLLYITNALNLLFNQFARGINKIKLVGIVGVVQTIIVVLSNVLLLVVFKFGIDGFVFSIVLSFLSGIIVLFFGGRLYEYVSVKTTEKRLMKEMLAYSIPITPNALSWWMNNTANRYIITLYSGINAVGLFSAASKMPTVLVTLQGIFYQAWQLSAINEYHAKDRAHFFSKIYNYYNIFMLLAASFLILFIKPLAYFLFGNEFYSAWKLVPFLLLSVIFGALSGFFGSLYVASKKTKMLFLTTAAGGIIAVGLNFLLVPDYGAFATTVIALISYFAIWLLRLRDTRRFITLNISVKKDVLSYIVIVIQAILIIYDYSIVTYLLAVVCLLLLIVLNYKLLHGFILELKGVLKKKFTKSIV